jgi:hypothetical protein
MRIVPLDRRFIGQLLFEYIVKHILVSRLVYACLSTSYINFSKQLVLLG